VIGERYYRNAQDSIIDLVDGDEMDMIERCQTHRFVQHFRARTHVDLAHAAMLWNTLRIRLGYETAPEAES
jgi:hypothetical protein